MGKLTVKGIAALSEPGMYPDGADCLYFRIGPTGAKSWIARPTINGKRKEMGLGPLSVVGLAEARKLAQVARAKANGGIDPVEERAGVRKAARDLESRERMTFQAVAELVHAVQKPTWTSEKHSRIWAQSLRDHVFPHFGATPIHQVGQPEVLKALTILQTAQPQTARKVRQRLATIFDWAKAAGHYPAENPLSGITTALPKVLPQVRHMPALPWRDLPALMAKFAQREGTSARCLQWIILTAARSNEGRGARWAEIEGNVWTIPAERTKTRKAHRVPLTPEALAILDRVRGLDKDLIFPSSHRGKDGAAKPMSDMVFGALFGRMKIEGITTHGFRSTFRDWASESAHAPREVAEACLAHVVGDATERAYARSDQFDRRTALMARWADYATGKAGVLVPMVANG